MLIGAKSGNGWITGAACEASYQGGEEGKGASAVNWQPHKAQGRLGRQEGRDVDTPRRPVDPPFGKVLKALSSTTFPNLNQSKANYSHLNSQSFFNSQGHQVFTHPEEDEIKLKLRRRKTHGSFSLAFGFSSLKA